MPTTNSPHDDLRTLIDAHREWLIIRSTGRSFPILNTEIDLDKKPDRLIFGHPDENGFLYWRITGFSAEEDCLQLDLTSDFGKTREKIKLVPRVSSKELGDAVELARLEKANQLAKLVVACYPGTKTGRVSLNKENGRSAHIIAAHPQEGKKAYISDISGKMTPETLLALAMIWLGKLERRKKDSINEVRIIAEKNLARALGRLLALLADSWKHHIRIVEISRKKDTPDLHRLPPLDISDLWRKKGKKLTIPDALRPSRTARSILAIDPEKIDVVFSRQGETLRFRGLPFARVRSVAGKERAWFGTGREKQILSDPTWPHLHTLMAELDTYRRPATPSKRHELFHTAPEAWLESLLKRDISRLDANLILSPIYNQFRASADKIDLLALRKDGRLVIIELKTSIDREMVFQAADYWRKIELQRRAGHLHQARLFGDLEILDRPALVYLVAPALSFHREFAFFAGALSTEIEMYRFDLHEKWRERIKVLGQRQTGENANKNQ